MKTPKSISKVLWSVTVQASEMSNQYITDLIMDGSIEENGTANIGTAFAIYEGVAWNQQAGIYRGTLTYSLIVN